VEIIVWGKKTGIYVDRRRLISEGVDEIELMLTIRNLRKFKDRINLRIFAGINCTEEWRDIGTYYIVNIPRESRLMKGLTYYCCKLRRIKEEEMMNNAS
jgi:aryl carrier-like protein